MCHIGGRSKSNRKREATRSKDVETVVYDDVESTDSEYATSCEDIDKDNNVSRNEWNDGHVEPLHDEREVMMKNDKIVLRDSKETAVKGTFRGYADTNIRVDERRTQYVPLDDEVEFRVRGDITREVWIPRTIHHVVNRIEPDDVTTTIL